MKILLIILLFFSINSFAQVVAHHTNYEVMYDTLRHYPIYVKWTQRADMENCNKLTRKNTFATDSLLKWTKTDKYFNHSGIIDRGHMMPAEINLCQGVWVEHQCFLMGNIAAQYRAVNRGSWKSYETICYNYAKETDLDIWAGCIGEEKKMGIVSIPTKCWKVVHKLKTDTWEALLFNNNSDDSNNEFPRIKVPVEIIEQLTQLKFK